MSSRILQQGFCYTMAMVLLWSITDGRKQYMDITYRLANESDIEELVRLRLAYLQADFGDLDPHDAKEIESRLPGYFQAHLGKDLYAQAAFCDGSMIGTCWLLVVEKPASVAFLHGRTGAIFNVYVDPAYRKRGIARDLMLRLIETARELHLDRLELRATAMGFNLYRSIGFVEDESSHRAMNYVIGSR